MVAGPHFPEAETLQVSLTSRRYENTENKMGVPYEGTGSPHSLTKALEGHGECALVKIYQLALLKIKIFLRV